MTHRRFAYHNLTDISTHILTKRMTDFHHILVGGQNYFNSHPHEEDDTACTTLFHLIMNFNSHPHEEDDCSVISFLLLILKFQLTSSRRGWPKSFDLIRMEYLHFNSHPHEEDDEKMWWQQQKKSVFQLTSSRRGWLKIIKLIERNEYISTHILTKRMTNMQNLTRRERSISTHILTKRMTPNVRKGWFLCIFQLTSSRRGWL